MSRDNIFTIPFSFMVGTNDWKIIDEKIIDGECRLTIQIKKRPAVDNINLIIKIE